MNSLPVQVQMYKCCYFVLALKKKKLYFTQDNRLHSDHCEVWSNLAVPVCNNNIASRTTRTNKNKNPLNSTKSKDHYDIDEEQT